MPQVRAIPAPHRAMPPARRASFAGVAMNRKTAAWVGAARPYVGVGCLAFQVAAAIRGDNSIANWIAGGLSPPLAAALFYAIGWIEKRL